MLQILHNLKHVSMSLLFIPVGEKYLIALNRAFESCKFRKNSSSSLEKQYLSMRVILFALVTGENIHNGPRSIANCMRCFLCSTGDNWLQGDDRKICSLLNH